MIKDAFANCEPPRDLTVWEWADEYRRLSREDSAEPGRWRTSRFEPQRGIMAAVTEPGVRAVRVKKGAQVGWTAICGNIIGYFVDQDPCPMLFLMPTLSLAENYSKDRLAPMFRDTPQLSAKLKPARSRDSGNTIRHKEFPGGYLALVGANSPTDLASRPIRVVLEDETDRYSENAGGDGDPQDLAEQRQTTFWNAVTVTGSTPKFKGGPIDRAFEESDKRMFFARCPHCEKHEPKFGYQTLHWEFVKFTRTDDGELDPDSVGYQCQHCGVLWDDADRTAAVNAGEWRATAPFRGTAGFFLSQLYSPWVPMHRMVAQFLRAKDNPFRLQVFVNTVLGEGWEDQGKRIDDEGLKSRAENYGPEDLPEGVLVATAGVDTHPDRLEVQVIGWGQGDEAWPILMQVLPGDPNHDEVWRDLDALLRRTFRTRDGRLIRTRATCIDMQGHNTDAVLQFCKNKSRRKIFAIRGQDGARPIWPQRASKSRKAKLPFRNIGIDTAKDRLAGRLRITLGENEDSKPGYVHFPIHEVRDGEDNGFGDAYFAQLTAEEVRTKMVKGRPVRYWHNKPGARNEAWDTFIYALAARQSLAADLRRYIEKTTADAAQLERPEPKPSKMIEHEPEAAPRVRTRRRSNWIDRRPGGWL